MANTLLSQISRSLILFYKHHRPSIEHIEDPSLLNSACVPPLRATNSGSTHTHPG